MTNIERQIVVFDNDGRQLFHSPRASLTPNSDGSITVTDLAAADELAADDKLPGLQLALAESQGGHRNG